METTQTLKRGPKPQNLERDANIRRLKAEGLSLAKIGELYDVSRQRICQIVNKETA